MIATYKGARLPGSSIKTLKQYLSRKKTVVATGDIILVKPSKRTDTILKYEVKVDVIKGRGYSGKGKSKKRQRSAYEKYDIKLLMI